MSAKTLLYRWLHRFSEVSGTGQEVETELQFHLEMRARENMRAGMSAAAAWEDARKRFGNLHQIKTICVKIRRGGRMTRTIHILEHWIYHPMLPIVAMLALIAGLGASICYCRAVADTSELLGFSGPFSCLALLRSWLAIHIQSSPQRGIAEFIIMAGLAIALVVCAMLIAYFNVASLVRVRFRLASNARQEAMTILHD
jgi:hypothetical protein